MVDQNNIEQFLEWCSRQFSVEWQKKIGVTILSTDNPGWLIEINLKGTSCEKKPFEKLKIEKNDNDWVHCFLSDGNFIAAGGPCNLNDMLDIFTRWVITSK